MSSDATALDVWSLEQLKTLFRNSTTDPHLRYELHQDKVIFFLHLLGLDTTGHAYRPRSKVCAAISYSNFYMMPFSFRNT